MNVQRSSIKRSFPLYLVLLCTIGPNLFFGLRMEHVIVYPFFLLLLLKPWAQKSLTVSRLTWLPVLLFIACLYCVLGDLYISPDDRMADYAASLGRLVEPPVLFVIFSSILEKEDSALLFKKGCFFTVTIGCLATLYTGISIAAPDNILSTFYSAGDDSVAKASFDVGRYLGFFNQPLEAGIFFSVALFCLYYLRVNGNVGSLFELGAFYIICIGGLLTLSKNFYLVGLACVGLYLLLSDRRLFFRYVFLVATLVVSGVYYVSVHLSSFIDSYLDLYNKFGVLSALSAGRFGGETQVTTLFKEVVSSGLFTGLGLGAFMPLDNGYLEYFYHGGILSLLCYALFTGAVLFGLHGHRKYLAGLRTGVGIFIILASIGGPVLTANRACIVLMFVIVGSIKLATGLHEREGTELKVTADVPASMI